MRKKREWILEFRFRKGLSPDTPYQEWEPVWSDGRRYGLEEATRELVKLMVNHPLVSLTHSNVKDDMLDLRLRNLLTDETIPLEALGY